MTTGLHHPWLVLWDIDHTLLETRGLGSELYGRAFKTATGTEMKQQADVTGQTEPSIFNATLRLHGIAEDEHYLTRYKQALAEEYEHHREDLRRRGRALPGAEETLATLAAEPALIQSVLSGNLRAVSKTKLDVFELDKYLDLEVGAYGDDDPERPQLVAIAQERAHRKYGTPFSEANTVVVGDSTHDINTGLEGGARSIGIATGSDDIDTLREAGAGAVLRDLTDERAVLAALHRLIT
ncbi:HAD hydrolase-like protein [Actinoplanes sp. M2I2]|uniref:HAD family hydrolase n=1 Tax=Actinoplanes sp. M2I2 TaxID=1734444 RepID=UPI0020218F10|nr:haloacid dehalogenase-like hydrolase [Actinoplanes sp. M2I2]